MKMWSILLLAVLPMVVPLRAANRDGLQVGDAMPAGGIRMENVDGRMLSLSETAGRKGTLVVFACNHCPYVQAWQQRLVTIGNDALQKGIGVIFVNSNDPLYDQ